MKLTKLTHHPNCVSTLPKVKTAHFETTVADRFLECVPSSRLFATFAESRLMFIFFIFLYDFLSAFWQKICCHIFIGFIYKTRFKTQYKK